MVPEGEKQLNSTLAVVDHETDDHPPYGCSLNVKALDKPYGKPIPVSWQPTFCSWIDYMYLNDFRQVCTRIG